MSAGCTSNARAVRMGWVLDEYLDEKIAGPGVSTGSRGKSSSIQSSARKPRSGPYSYMRAIKRMSTVATWARVAPVPGLSSPVAP